MIGVIEVETLNLGAKRRIEICAMNERRELEILVGRYGFCLAGKGRCTDAANACWSFFEIVVHSGLKVM